MAALIWSYKKHKVHFFIKIVKTFSGLKTFTALYYHIQCKESTNVNPITLHHCTASHIQGNMKISLTIMSQPQHSPDEHHGSLRQAIVSLLSLTIVRTTVDNRLPRSTLIKLLDVSVASWENFPQCRVTSDSLCKS